VDARGAPDDRPRLAARDGAGPAGRPSGERIRLLVSDEAPSPLSWGWLKPAILIDRDTLERVEDADAILAHEVAHVVRGDWPALMMTRLSVAIFWFNPLAWLLERELVQQAEEAADCSALGQVEPTQYAQTLVSCARAERLQPLPANSMAPRASGLKRRVHAILSGRMSTRSGSFWTLAAMLGCAGAAAPLAAVELVPAMAELVEAPAAPVAPVAPVAAAARIAAAAPAPAAPAALAAVAQGAPAAPVAPPAPATPTPPAESFIDVPPVDVDVPATVVDVPEVRINEAGLRVHVPAMKIAVPRVQVKMDGMKVRMPHPPATPMPPLPTAAIAASMQGWSAEDRAEFEAEMREVRARRREPLPRHGRRCGPRRTRNRASASGKRGARRCAPAARRSARRSVPAARRSARPALRTAPAWRRARPGWNAGRTAWSAARARCARKPTSCAIRPIASARSPAPPPKDAA
jgi:hypothetical protein